MLILVISLKELIIYIYIYIYIYIIDFLIDILNAGAVYLIIIVLATNSTIAKFTVSYFEDVLLHVLFLFI